MSKATKAELAANQDNGWLAFSELTDLLKTVDRVTYHNSQRWAYYDEVDTKLWYVREEFRKDSREVWHGPSLLEALRVLVEEKAQS